MYQKYFKRGFDFICSFAAIVMLSPVFVLLIVLGAISLRGNPFFLQSRPGKDERIFRLIKFRTMTDQRDDEGKLLPDEIRLTKYGSFLRSTSLDELPELFNILLGHMSIVGPRPLLVSYLDLYTEAQHVRHLVRPGLTGLAQVNGRNNLSWEERFVFDAQYVRSITFWGDIKIILATVASVVRREGISSETSATMEAFTGTKE